MTTAFYEIANAADAVVTVCTGNYLHYARALAQSIHEHQPTLPIFACVVDVAAGELSTEAKPLHLFAAEQLPISAWRRFAFQYRPLELCAALVPWVVQYLFDTIGCRRVVYLDCDIQVYAELTPVYESLDQYDVVLTPHLTAPLPVDGRIPSEMQILRTGVYNGGFLAVREGTRARQMLAWWQAKLRSDCVIDVPNHRYANQRFLDLVPGLFEGVKIERSSAYNVAYWNVPPRELRLDADGKPQVDGRPLIFFHYSNFDPRRPDRLTTHPNRLTAEDESVVRSLLSRYVRLLNECGMATFGELPYGFRTLSNGYRIRDGWRMAVRLNHPTLVDIEDPFDARATPGLALRLSWASWQVRRRTPDE